ncbi:MAG TPA: hypothetical protein VFU47_10615, partial [Armatimonadota bacterium]|nr:hypothetical protein [Armatimonadota bacterium]
LMLRERLGDRLGIVECAGSLATLAVRDGDVRTALRLFGFASAMREVLGTPVHPSEQPEQERWMTEARSGVDPAQADTWWQQGRALTLTQAIEEARAFANPVPPRTPDA